MKFLFVSLYSFLISITLTKSQETWFLNPNIKPQAPQQLNNIGNPQVDSQTQDQTKQQTWDPQPKMNAPIVPIDASGLNNFGTSGGNPPNVSPQPQSQAGISMRPSPMAWVQPQTTTWTQSHTTWSQTPTTWVQPQATSWAQNPAASMGAQGTLNPMGGGLIQQPTIPNLPLATLSQNFWRKVWRLLGIQLLMP